MDRLKRILRSKRFLIPVGLLIAYTLAGFFLVPYLVRHYVPRVLDETLHRPAAIGEVRFNPFVYTFEANDFSLTEPDGTPIAGFKRLFVDFELKSLFNWAWTFRTVTVEAPLVNAVVAPDGVLNLARLVPPAPAARRPRRKPGEPPRLIFEEVTIEQGEVDFTDRRQAEPAQVAFKPLHLDIRNLTTLPHQEGAQDHHGRHPRRRNPALDRASQPEPRGLEGPVRDREAAGGDPLEVRPRRPEPGSPRPGPCRSRPTTRST